MQELTLLQKYDAVLEVLYDISGKSPTFDRIAAFLQKEKKKVDGGELWDILNTMIKDGYVYFVKNNNTEEELYLLSFDGKLLKETGGLEVKINHAKTKEEEDRKLNTSNLKTARYTRRNIRIGWLLGGVTFLVVVANLYITIRKDNREAKARSKDTLQQSKNQQNASEVNQSLREISSSLKDTSPKKIKVVKK